MKQRYYLAYGSNLNVEQMLWRCPGARPVGTAWIDGYELLFKGSRTGSYLTMEPRKGAKVPVAVWTVTAKNEASLDRYEGFPTFYYKKEIPVTYKEPKTEREHTVTAFIYIMHEHRPIGIPSPQYVEICEAGYRFFGFDTAYLAKALEKSRREALNER